MSQDQRSAMTPAQINILKTSLYPTAPQPMIDLLVATCDRTGLDPFARQVFMVSRKTKLESGDWGYKWEIQTSIDGLRVIAERSGIYRGQMGPYWCGRDKKWTDVWLEKGPPAAAKVGVLKEGFKEPLWSVARFDAYAQRYRDGRLNPMWEKMGDTMSAKCAEALALRRAFPNLLSGLYTNDEMAQAETTDPAATAPTTLPPSSTPPPPSLPPQGDGEPAAFRVAREAREARAREEEAHAAMVRDRELTTQSREAADRDEEGDLDRALQAPPKPTDTWAPSHYDERDPWPESEVAPTAGPLSIDERPTLKKFAPPEFLPGADGYRINFGKHTGKMIRQIGLKAAAEYAQWLRTKAEGEDKPMSVNAAEFCHQVELYIKAGGT